MWHKLVAPQYFDGLTCLISVFIKNQFELFYKLLHINLFYDSFENIEEGLTYHTLLMFKDHKMCFFYGTNLSGATLDRDQIGHIVKIKLL